MIANSGRGGVPPATALLRAVRHPGSQPSGHPLGPLPGDAVHHGEPAPHLPDAELESRHDLAVQDDTDRVSFPQGGRPAQAPGPLLAQPDDHPCEARTGRSDGHGIDVREVHDRLRSEEQLAAVGLGTAADGGGLSRWRSQDGEDGVAAQGRAGSVASLLPLLTGQARGKNEQEQTAAEESVDARPTGRCSVSHGLLSENRGPPRERRSAPTLDASLRG